jgi:hypothetical protein
MSRNTHDWGVHALAIEAASVCLSAMAASVQLKAELVHINAHLSVDVPKHSRVHDAGWANRKCNTTYSASTKSSRIIWLL